VLEEGNVVSYLGMGKIVDIFQLAKELEL